MILSYRTRHNLRRIGKFCGIFAIIAAILWLIWIIWVSKYMLYDRDLGARLDFSLGPIPQGTLAVPPSEGDPVNIFYKEPDLKLPNTEAEKTSIQGYYLELEDLKSDKLPELMATLDTLGPGTAIMLDVKAPKGWFYYSTDIDNRYEDQAPAQPLSMTQMDDLIRYMDSRDLYLIARLPAFRDYWFGRYNVSSGLAEKGKKGALWMDNGCYWLDPTNDNTLNYLVRITKELQSMGFDEVVYYDFRFPKTDKIEFSGDQAQAIVDAAATLSTACATDQFCVSFSTEDAAFPLPQGNCRLYFQGVAAADAETVAQQVVTDDPSLHILFMTTANDATDTRFEAYCVLRPIESAN